MARGTLSACLSGALADTETDMENPEKIIGLIIGGSLPCFQSNTVLEENSHN
ncbi:MULTISPECIES: hypothetical protein [unclassified Massilia]|uniref:hypothetical protein n=1 Tax=unclassified Massilia TaxID=2609279 RepID=UPI0012E12067|nr:MULTISPECIES: hypothetical protein [unclassified Massilia]